MRQLLFIVVALLICFGVAFGANTGENSPASSAQESGGAWTNLDSLFASDDERASIVTVTDSLYVTNFTMGVPDGATIDSIFVTTEAQGSATQAARRRLDVHLVKDGTTQVGDHITFNHDLNSDTQTRLTGSTDPLWGTTWTATEINATTFGIQAMKQVSQTGTILVDHVTIYVAYTEVGGAKGSVMSSGLIN